MPLKDYKSVSKITTASGLVSVTVNGVTFNAYKCVVADLEFKLIPSPDSGASYQGAVLVKDTATGNIGLFLLVAGNPSSTASGGINAREVWLAPWGGWTTEYTSAINALNTIAAPVAGQYITFSPLTGTNPHLLNQITPTGASSGCVSASLIDQRVFNNALDTLQVFESLAEYQAANGPLFAAIGSGHYIQGSGNSVTLPAGTWNLNGFVDFTNNGGAVGYTSLKTLWALTNGNNTASVPTALGAILEAGSALLELTTSATDSFDINAPITRVNLVSPTQIFLVPFATMATFANARILTRIYAQRVI